MRKVFLIALLAILCAFAVPVVAGCSNPPATARYRVVWCYDDGEVINEEEYSSGAVPIYRGETPSSRLSHNTVYETMRFEGWVNVNLDDEVIENEESGFQPVKDRDVKYYAVYTPEVTKFSFCFKNYDGQVLLEVDDAVFEDEVAPQQNPTKPSSGTVINKFAGWDIDWDEFWHNNGCVQYIDGGVKVVTAQFRQIDTTVNTEGLLFEANEDNTAYYVSDYRGEEHDVVIAATYNGLPVEGIGSWAFNGTNASTVYIAEGIKYIRSHAFGYGGIHDISVPNSIERVASNAFPYDVEIEREDGLIYMGNDQNPYLVLIGRRTIIENVVINENTKVIIDDMFISDDYVKSIVLPEGIKSIPYEMARGTTKLESIVIPSSVTKIEGYAFYQSSVKTVEVKGSLDSIGWAAFEECEQLEEITFRANVKTIDSYAFEGCVKLETVNVDGYVEEINYDAFKFCARLQHIDLNEGLKKLEYGVFYNCDELRNISIPNSIEEIDQNAFYECDNLNFYVEDNSRFLGNSENKYLVLYDFENYSTNVLRINAKTKIYIPYINNGYDRVYFDGTLAEWLDFALNQSKKTEYGLWRFDDLYINNEKLQGEIVIPDTVTEIPYSAFKSQDEITSIVIPSTVTSIGDYAFSGCGAIQTLAIPNSVETIGENAFGGCLSLESVTLSDSLTSIPKGCFIGCSALIGVVIPSNVERIEEYAFNECNSLESVTFSDSLTYIGIEAFSWCTSLIAADLPDTLEELGSWAFGRCSSLQYVKLPEGLELIDYCTFVGCNSLCNIVIPDTVTEIRANAFCESGLTEVIVPDSVTTLGQGAFNECYDLAAILLPSSLTTIEQNLVYRSNDALKIYYAGTESQWNGISIESTGNSKLDGRVIVSTMADLSETMSANNYTLTYEATDFEIDGDVIKIGTTLFVREGNDFVGYNMVAENNKIRFERVSTLDLSGIQRIKDGISDYVFNGDEYAITFVDGCLAYVSDEEFIVNGVHVSDRKIVYDGVNCIFSLVAEGDEYTVIVSDIGQNKIYTPTDNEVSLFFIALDYYGNYCQTNVVHLINPADSKNYGNRVDYKQDGDKIYVHQEEFSSGNHTTRYLAKEGDKYYFYDYYNSSWYKSEITAEQYNQNKATGVTADTRLLLFDGSNYTKNDNVYTYTGEEVYFEMDGQRFVYDSISLAVNGNELVISFSVAGGVITGTYSFNNVNTTVIELPTV